MSAIGIYFRGMTKPETNAIRARLNEHAAEHGYVAARGPTAGQGNLAALLVAIQAGEVFTCLLSDAEFGEAMRHLEDVNASWARSIIASMELAEQYRVDTE
jgi:hypothetical protein